MSGFIQTKLSPEHSARFLVGSGNSFELSAQTQQCLNGSELPIIRHALLLVKRFLRRPMVELLTIGVKCSCLRAKGAHISGHLPIFRDNW
jgi:hypothetical protein